MSSSFQNFDTYSIPTTTYSPKFIRGVDTLRFFAALWVVFSHGAWFPLEAYVDPSLGILQTIAVGVSKMAFNGTAAVVVFFIISGFCIHYPNIGKADFSWQTFLLRRMIRIGIPLMGIIAATTLAGPEYTEALDRVLWSVYCEIVYYLLYPVIFVVATRWSMSAVLAGSAAISFCMLIMYPNTVYLWEFGTGFTWLFCAPFWLAGSWLATQVRNVRRFPRLVSIWIWRGAFVFGCMTTTVVAHHLPFHVGYTWTMPVFTVFCTAWLWVELARWEERAPVVLWEKLGALGYSIYLVHRPVIEYFTMNWRDVEPTVAWVVKLLAVFLLSAAFYKIIEKPSHNTAKKFQFRKAATV